MNLPTIYLDMDGTIADLYSFPSWLPCLQNEDTLPYRKAKPLLTEEQVSYLQNYIKEGGSVGIISWTSKNGTAEYNNKVRSAKVAWLKRNLPLPYARIHIVRYGTPKSRFGKVGDILIDDEHRNVSDYNGCGRTAYLPSEWNEMVGYLERKYKIGKEIKR